MDVRPTIVAAAASSESRLWDVMIGHVAANIDGAGLRKSHIFSTKLSGARAILLKYAVYMY